MSDQFPHLFSPLQVGPHTIRNRIAMTAHGTNLGKENLATDDHVAYYRERARGGVGLIIMEALRIHPTSSFNMLSMHGYDRRIIPRLRKIADTVHAHGARIVVQLVHAGRQMTGIGSRTPVWAPSPIPCPQNREVPHAMTVDEIQETIGAFAQVARIVHEAGMDGVELHGAHGYLIQQFMSPLTNVREDQYGGSLENRLRFPREVINQVRNAVGENFIVGIRLSGDEFTDGGLALDDMLEISQGLAETGQLDLLHISQSNYVGFSYATMIPDMHFPLGAFTYLAAGVKQVVDSIPIITVARINDPVQAEQILADGQADMIGMARAHIADPEFSLKAREGRVEDIRMCIGCNQGCVGMVHREKRITCLQNPSAGLERSLGLDTIRRVEHPKRVMVIGGGPAGMEAAILAAQRGHQVRIFDRQEQLGGQVNLAMKNPLREEFGGSVIYRRRMIEKLGIEVSLGVEVTPDLVADIRPDAIILASGSRPKMPDLSGIDQPNVFSIWDVFQDGAKIGNRVIFIDTESGYRSLGTAEYLADRGCSVELITPFATAGLDYVTVSQSGLQFRLHQSGITIIPNTRLAQIDGSHAKLVDVFTGEERYSGEADAFIIAMGNTVDDSLAADLKTQHAEVLLAGDCVAPRTALEAIWEGHNAGRTV